MEIKIQEMTDPSGRTRLTIRANGRYLGTLYCAFDERAVIVQMIQDGSQPKFTRHTFALEVREK